MKYFKCLIILVFLFPLSVFADEERVLVECPNNVKESAEIECLIIGYSSYYVSALELEITIPDNVEKINTTIDKIWEGTEEDNLFLLYTDSNKINKFNIGKLRLKAKENIKNINIKIEYLSYGDEEFNQNEIITKKDVKETENKREKNVRKKNNFSKYVIIIMIIGLIVVGILVFIKIRSGKNEK